MIKPMFGHRPKPKKFDYKPRFYDPKEDERRRQRQRIKIKRGHRKYHQGRSVLMYAVILCMVLYAIYLLGTV